MAIEIMDLPIENGYFPVRELLVSQRVSTSGWNFSIHVDSEDQWWIWTNDLVGQLKQVEMDKK